jgi:hypothetical protein
MNTGHLRAEANTDHLHGVAEEARNSQGSRATVVLLWSLTALFAVRVLGQAIQRWWPQAFLPPFDTFQGSGLRYPILLAAQAVILGLMVRVARRVSAGTLSTSRVEVRLLTLFGGLYMAGSVLRIVIGLAVPTAPHWFKAWIPALFHLVLAGFVITLTLQGPRPLPDSARNSGART